MSIAKKKFERKTDLTQLELMELLAYDVESGVLSWRSGAYRNSYAGLPAGKVTKLGYTMIKIKGSRYLAHRLVWLFVHGVWPDGDIDHINGVKTDNRLSNLRDVPHGVNQQNIRAARKDNKSGLLGVYWRKSDEKWVASISINGRQKYLGKFDCKKAAGEAYLNAKRAMHEGCTI